MDNQWVGHSVTKPIDAELFQKLKTHKKDATRKMTTSITIL